jgi:hypothetical protein
MDAAAILDWIGEDERAASAAMRAGVPASTRGLWDRRYVEVGKTDNPYSHYDRGVVELHNKWVLMDVCSASG